MIDVRSVFERRVAEQLAAHPELAERVDAVLQVEIDGPTGGAWTIDLTRKNAPPRLTPGKSDHAKVRIAIAESDFADLIAGRQRWTDAFVKGKIDVEGNLVTAIKLRTLFAQLSNS
jgi:SCP-2 sterol transfer family